MADDDRTATELLVIPTCVGCGAMGIPGSCERGCREERLDLVGADSLEELAAELARSDAAVAAFAPIVREIARAKPPAGGFERAYRRLQQAARAALREHPQHEAGLPAEDSVREATAWSCPRCGGLEAPQPCLGICVWRPVEWVPRAVWEQERERVELVRAEEAALRRLLRQLAFVTPRKRHWKAGWQALGTTARAISA